MRVLVTGGAGFIGSEFSIQLLKKNRYELIILDSLTYAGNISNLNSIKSDCQFVKGDIRDKTMLDKLFSQNKFEAVVHFAAESHVDNSIENPNVFLETNVEGTVNLLSYSSKYNLHKFVHISTDEVYGSIETGFATEDFSFNPSSPYSASKASAENFVNAWSKTYGLPTTTVRCSNNYGPRQHDEKLIPRAIGRLLRNSAIPVYGTGNNIREWIHVSDCARGILSVFESDSKVKHFNISSGVLRTNLEIVHHLLDIFKMDESYLDFVQDRKGHDFRYAIDSSLIKTELGWSPTITLDFGLRMTVEWYRQYVSEKL